MRPIGHAVRVSDRQLSRRDLIATGASGAVLLSAGGFPLTSTAARRRRRVLLRSGGFGSGVAAGQPSRRGALLWTRVDDVERSGLLRLEVARDPEFRRLVDSRLVTAGAQRDFTVHERVYSRRLRPDEEYFYRFETGTTQSRVGRFRTRRPADSRAPVRIAFFSCQRFEHGFFTPQTHIAADEDLDLVVSLGDYIYEEDATPIAPERDDPSGAPNGHVERIEQFRSRYRTYRSDERLQEMHARHAVQQIWDDCEVEGNWAGPNPSSGPSPVDQRAIPFAEKRRNGIRAYFEHMPVDMPTGPDRNKVYRSVDLGMNAELLLLDTRQFRDEQPCEDGTFQDGPCFEGEQVPRRRLGTAQKDWLKRRLLRSPATWKILGNAQMMMALDIAPGQPVAYDSWDGYGLERREVLEYVADRGIQDVTSIVGDVHVFLAGDLHTDGRVTGRRVGTEFVGASVSHDALELPGLNEEQSALATERIPLANPHLRFAQFRNRGYAVLEARPDELEVTFRAVDTVRQPQSAAFDLARFRVRSGVPAAERIA